jgi:spermidine synthase
VDRLYFWDLLGAGVGCAGAVALMNALSPPGAAVIAGACFAAGGAVFAAGRTRATGVALCFVLLGAAPFAPRLPFTPADSKHLAVLTGRGEIVFQRWTALFRTDVLRLKDDAVIGPRGNWGLSQTVTDGVQDPWGFVAHDASAGTEIYDLREGRLDYLEDHILRLPYLVVNPEPRVLVIGVGGGRDVIAAQRFGASHVTGVELDPVTVALMRDELSELGAGLFRGPLVELVAGEGRHFVRRTRERYDLIQITGVDTLAATAQGAYVLAENYLYTVEAFHDYLDRLAPGGILSIGTAHLPWEAPRSAGRTLSVARRALEERGVRLPERHLVAVASAQILAEVLVKNEPFTAAELETLQGEVQRLRFHPLLLGAASDLRFRQLASARGERLESFFDENPYLIRPITDDSPFFFRFFRWRDLLTTADLGASHVTALGQLVLGVLLVSLTLFGGLFVLAPLFVFRRRRVVRGLPAFGVLAYFLAVGLGFMLFEISLLQHFVLYLGYPTYSLTVVLFALLTSLSIGSFLSRRWVGREHRVLPLGVGIIAALAFFYMRGLPILQDATLGAPLAVRAALSVAVLAPLGLTLGAFFPLGIRRAEAIHADLVPWAWGINGCASVTATVLAVVLGMDFGFERVWLLSLAIYAAGVAALLGTTPRRSAASVRT